MRWAVILETYDIKIPLGNLFLYRLAGFSAGYITAMPYLSIDPVRLMLLKRHNLKTKEGISSIFIDRAMQISTDIIFGVVGITLLLLHFSLSRNLEISLLILIIFSTAFLGMYFYRMSRGKPFFSLPLGIGLLQRHAGIRKLKRYIEDVERLVHEFFSRNTLATIKITIFSLIYFFMVVAEFAVGTRIFGFNLSLVALFILPTAVGIAYNIPIPFSLGVLEVSQLTSAGIIGFDRIIAVSLSLLVRLKDVIRVAIGLLALLYFGTFSLIMRKIKDAKPKGDP